MLSCYFLFFFTLHLYVFVLIWQYYVVLPERTNKYIIYNNNYCKNKQYNEEHQYHTLCIVDINMTGLIKHVFQKQ